MSDTLDVDPEEMYSTALYLRNQVNAHRHLAGELNAFAPTGAGRSLDLGSLRAAASRLETAAGQIANAVNSIGKSLDALQRAEQNASRSWGDKLRSKLPDWMKDGRIPNMPLHIGPVQVPSRIWIPGKGIVDTTIDPVELGLGFADSAQGLWAFGGTVWRATPWEAIGDIRAGRPTVYEETGASLWWVGNSLIHDDPPRRQLLGELLNERAFDEGGAGRWFGKSVGDLLQSLAPGAIAKRIQTPGLSGARQRRVDLDTELSAIRSRHAIETTELANHPFFRDAIARAEHPLTVAEARRVFDAWHARQIERIEGDMDGLAASDRRSPATDRRIGALQAELQALRVTRADARLDPRQHPSVQAFTDRRRHEAIQDAYDRLDTSQQGHVSALQSQRQSVTDRIEQLERLETIPERLATGTGAASDAVDLADHGAGAREDDR
jgi:hypothetical protein